MKRISNSIEWVYYSKIYIRDCALLVFASLTWAQSMEPLKPAAGWDSVLHFFGVSSNISMDVPDPAQVVHIHVDPHLQVSASIR